LTSLRARNLWGIGKTLKKGIIGFVMNLPSLQADFDLNGRYDRNLRFRGIDGRGQDFDSPDRLDSATIILS